MRIMAKVIALGVALTALPALAMPRDDYDRVAQKFTNGNPQEVRTARDGDQPKTGPCAMACPCGHMKPPAKEAPKS